MYSQSIGTRGLTAAGNRVDSDFLAVQGYLVHMKDPPRRTLQKGFTQGPMVVLGGRGVFERFLVAIKRRSFVTIAG